MNAIFLSGESINNKVWIEEVEKNLQNLFEKTKILFYNHWEDGQSTIDLEKEFSKLPELVKDMDEYFLFAKSIGSVLSVKGIYEKVLTPQKCFFAGPAFLVGEKNIPGFSTWIKNFSIPSIIVCKTNDPVAPALQTHELLEKYEVKNYKFVEISGDNHKYEDLTQIKALITEFIT